MRQWLVDPRIMCRRHLLGEHVEHHMFVGTINKGISVDGYLRDNLLEPLALDHRHRELAKEMERRGYNHNSPLPDFKIALPIDDLCKEIDKDSALKELLRRCPECQANYLRIYGKPPL